MKKFLSNLYQGIDDNQFIELRCFPVVKDTQPPVQEFYSPMELDELVERINVLNDAHCYHICVGILPRNQKSGKTEGIDTLQALWIDIDAKDMDMQQLRTHVLNLGMKPSAIVNSGNGYHCYWFLDKGYKLDNTEIREIEKKLHTITKADKTFDASRVLRVPGTLNCKDMHSLKVCRVITMKGDLRYSLDQMTSWIEKEYQSFVQDNIPEVKTINSRNTTPENLVKYEFSNWGELKRYLTPFLIARIIELPLHLRDEHGKKLDRSKNDFYIATALLELGFTAAQVKLAFKIFSDNDFAAGTKYKEMGDKYLDEYTIPSAKEAAPHSIYELLDHLRALEAAGAPEQEILTVAGSALKLVKNTRAEQFLGAIESAVLGGTYLDKAGFVEFAKNSISGDGAYVFEQFAGINKKPKIMHKKIAEYVVADNPYIRIGTELYRYDKGVYTLDVNLQILASHIWAITENRPVGSAIGLEYTDLADRTWLDLKQRDITEIASYVAQNAPVLDLTKPLLEPDLICVQNGMVNWKTGALVAHDPKYMRLAQLDVVYDPSAKSALLEKFMQETFHKEDIPVIWEFMGVSISESVTAKRFMIFVGSGDNGKSVWLNVVRKVLGPNNISSANLSDLASNRFAKAQLLGKLANIASDISGNALNDISNIKELTGNDQTSADRKFQAQVNFVNKASLMFSCNVLPEANAADEAYFKRLLIVECPNQVPEEKQDKHLEDKLTTTNARSAWLNLALAGLRQYNEQDQVFTTSTKIADIVHAHKVECRPDIAFIDRYVKKQDGAFLTIDMVMKELKSWAQVTSSGIVPPKSVIKTLITKKFPKIRLAMSSNGTPGYNDLAVDTKKVREDLNLNNTFSININTSKQD